MENYISKIIKKYCLNINSTPCEICNAMNGLEKIVETKSGVFSNKSVEIFKPRYPLCDETRGGDGGSFCLDKDKAIIKLYFLQLTKDVLLK